MAQRITNNMMMNSFNRNIQQNAGKMTNIQSQLATNKKLVRLSDDPVSVVKVLNAKSRMYDIDQYQKNLSDAEAWLTQTETAMNEGNNIIKRAYELSVYAANEVLGPDELNGIANEMKQLRDQVINLGNASLGNKYIFGSYNVSSAPFDADPETGDVTLNGQSMIDAEGDFEYISYEINTSLDFEISISGSQFLGVGEENNLYYMLNDFANTLMDPEATAEKKQSFIPKFLEAQNNMLAQLSEVGGRQARIEFMQNRYSEDRINYTQMRSDVEDLDQAEAIMHFSMSEAVYRAALSAGSKIIQPTLVDFMR